MGTDGALWRGWVSNQKNIGANEVSEAEKTSYREEESEVGVRSLDKALACLGTVKAASKKQTEGRMQLDSTPKTSHGEQLGEQRGSELVQPVSHGVERGHSNSWKGHPCSLSWLEAHCGHVPRSLWALLLLYFPLRRGSVLWKHPEILSFEQLPFWTCTSSSDFQLGLQLGKQPRAPTWQWLGIFNTLSLSVPTPAYPIQRSNWMTVLIGSDVKKKYK